MQDEVIRRFVGYCPDETLPFERGQFVMIPKGTKIRSTNPARRETVAGRPYRVRIHHFMPGMTITPDTCREHETPGPKATPQIGWPGAGGYWCEADVNDVLVQSVTYQLTTEDQLKEFASECAKLGIRTERKDDLEFFIEVFGIAAQIDMARGIVGRIDPA